LHGHQLNSEHRVQIGPGKFGFAASLMAAGRRRLLTFHHSVHPCAGRLALSPTLQWRPAFMNGIDSNQCHPNMWARLATGFRAVANGQRCRSSHIYNMLYLTGYGSSSRTPRQCERPVGRSAHARAAHDIRHTAGREVPTANTHRPGFATGRRGYGAGPESTTLRERLSAHERQPDPISLFGICGERVAMRGGRQATKARLFPMAGHPSALRHRPRYYVISTPTNQKINRYYGPTDGFVHDYVVRSFAGYGGTRRSSAHVPNRTSTQIRGRRSGRE